MEINKAIMESLRNLGLNAQSLTEYIKAMEEEDAKRKAAEEKRKQAEIRAAREEFTESLMMYLLKLNVISMEELHKIDMNYLMECIEEIENEIISSPLFKVPKEQKEKELGKIAATEAIAKKKPEKVNLKPIDPFGDDMDIITNWLASL